jgi:hypothetical protein
LIRNLLRPPKGDRPVSQAGGRWFDPASPTWEPGVEIVRIRPKERSKDRLAEIRPRFISDTKRMHPGVISATLADGGDGTFVDIWVWNSREEAQAALDAGASIPGFAEWAEQVDVVSFEMLDVVDEA